MPPVEGFSFLTSGIYPFQLGTEIDTDILIYLYKENGLKSSKFMD